MARETLMTTAQVAEAEGCSYVNIIFHIRAGNLRAEKVGRDWVIRRKDYDAWHKARAEAAQKRARDRAGE